VGPALRPEKPSFLSIVSTRPSKMVEEVCTCCGIRNAENIYTHTSTRLTITRHFGRWSGRPFFANIIIAFPICLINCSFYLRTRGKVCVQWLAPAKFDPISQPGLHTLPAKAYVKICSRSSSAEKIQTNICVTRIVRSSCPCIPPLQQEPRLTPRMTVTARLGLLTSKTVFALSSKTSKNGAKKFDERNALGLGQLASWVARSAILVELSTSSPSKAEQ
jgi:hypothetical protein